MDKRCPVYLNRLANRFKDLPDPTINIEDSRIKVKDQLSALQRDLCNPCENACPYAGSYKPQQTPEQTSLR
jgi:hypothetical protein